MRIGGPAATGKYTFGAKHNHDRRKRRTKPSLKAGQLFFSLGRYREINQEGGFRGCDAGCRQRGVGVNAESVGLAFFAGRSL